MKLVEMRCKNCGAELEVDPSKTVVVCNYCQAKFKLDDEVVHVKHDDMNQSGYEFEMGRARAQAELEAARLNVEMDDLVRQKRNLDQMEADQAKYGTNNQGLICFLLCFFFGCLGVHKFYEGKTGTGILYLFTFGIFGIGWFIDIIIYGVRLLKK